MPWCRPLLPLLAFFALSQASALAQEQLVQPVARPFALRQVRLLPGPFHQAQERDRQYILRLDPERLLHNFRVTAGLQSSAEPLGGWEKPEHELRGHSVGHYLSALGLMFASTGDTALKQRADYLVAELAKCQNAMPARGFDAGFLSAYPEEFFDRLETGKRVWAPYYTLHKIMAGLLEVHVQCGNQQALEVANRMAAWVKFRVDRLPPEQMQKVLTAEHGGMHEVCANLFAFSHHPDHQKMAQAFRHAAVLDPLARGEDNLNKLHANSQIPKAIGAAREFELTGEKRSHDIATFFWRRVVGSRSWVIGGHGDNEHFFPVEQTARHLSTTTAETCNTYNMLKLTRHLFAWEPAGATMDFYERALYNHILASQDPENGMTTYFAALKPGHFKVYSTPLESFWCCLGTGMESHAKYGDSIYFHSADALWINLFIPSELSWKERGMTVRQETKFPEQETTTLTLTCKEPTQLALKIRAPKWAAESAIVFVNGSRQIVSSQNGYFTLERLWKSGDKIEVKLPMSLQLEHLPDDPKMVTVLYGPIVLAAELGTEDLPPDGQQARDHNEYNRMPGPPPPVVIGKSDDMIANIRRVAGKPLNFTTDAFGLAKEVSLIPFHRVHHQRHAVYWRVEEGTPATISGTR